MLLSLFKRKPYYMHQVRLLPFIEKPTSNFVSKYWFSTKEEKKLKGKEDTARPKVVLFKPTINLTAYFDSV